MTYDQIDPNTCQTLLEYAHQPVPAPMLCNNQVNTQVQIGDTFVFHSLLSFYHGDMSLMRGEWCKVGSVDFLVRMLKRERIDTSNEIYRKFEAEHVSDIHCALTRGTTSLTISLLFIGNVFSIPVIKGARGAVNDNRRRK